MPVYNGEKYLEESIESILNQTFTDFEFIIVNDGSSDRSSEILMQYKKLDKRIVVITNETNLGIAGATNIGIDQAKGEYIAFMDQDDISIKDRFLKEVTYLDKQPEIFVLGANSVTLDKAGNLINRPNIFETPGLIRWGMLFRNQVQNSTAMVRRSLFTDFGYRLKNYSPAQDYYLWMEVSLRHKIANLTESLLYHRLHESNASDFLKEKLSPSVYFIKKELIKKTLGVESFQEVIDGVINPSDISDKKIATESTKLILKWLSWNLDKKLLSEEKRIIKHKSSQMIRNIWYFQNHSFKLLPYYLMTIFLD